jgi:hypothetical protein
LQSVFSFPVVACPVLSAVVALVLWLVQAFRR